MSLKQVHGSNRIAFGAATSLDRPTRQAVERQIARRLYCLDPRGLWYYSWPMTSMVYQWQGVFLAEAREHYGQLQFKPGGPDWLANPPGLYRLGVDDIDLAICAGGEPPTPDPQDFTVDGLDPDRVLSSTGEPTITITGAGFEAAAVERVYVRQRNAGPPVPEYELDGWSIFNDGTITGQALAGNWGSGEYDVYVQGGAALHASPVPLLIDPPGIWYVQPSAFSVRSDVTLSIQALLPAVPALDVWISDSPDPTGGYWSATGWNQDTTELPMVGITASWDAGAMGGLPVGPAYVLVQDDNGDNWAYPLIVRT